MQEGRTDHETRPDLHCLADNLDFGVVPVEHYAMSASAVPGGDGSLGATQTGASLLPPPPPAVPPDLTRATARYKRHAWLAGLGLLAFVALYLSLTGWFLWTCYRLFVYAFSGARDGFMYGVVAVLSGLLGLFLLGALFFIKTGGEPNKNEITAADEPELFAFLYALADRVGAPRPHRVFLSSRVNAGVFYDLSFINLLVPTRKNLEIGLGLVNTLTLSEFTAVLAHEFGHFAQRSMAVGRWVYTAQQVAGQVVVARSWLDKLLAGLSQIDLRVAWIGWIMRIIVWSIRSLLDTAFRAVVLAERALGREMEFQADLVSVSVTGSDALVNALHRLGAADGAWSVALSVLAREAGRGKAVPDLFTLQTRVIEHMARILNEPDHGASPQIPAENPEEHRVFEQELAEPPRMWSTHPPNRDRELNAKRVYVPATLDSRSAFCLFRNPKKLRKRVTAEILAEAKEKLVRISEEKALAAVDKRFDKPYLSERYRGVYLGRQIGLTKKTPGELYGGKVPEDQIIERLAALYPEELASDIRDLRVRTDERSSLEALRDGLLRAPGGVIRHRGRVIPRRALASLLEEVTTEVETIRERVEAHDRACRSAHRAAAKALGQGWGPYLKGLVKLHHYAAHAEANLADAQGYLANVFAIVTADGHVSSSERQRLIVSSVEVHSALEEIFGHRTDVWLPREVFRRLVDALGIHGAEKPPKKYADLFSNEFTLPPANEHNIGDWFQVIDGWIDEPLRIVGALARVSLEMIVEAEEHVHRAYVDGTDPGEAPKPPVVPERYQTLTRDQVRERQKQLDLWDRFQIADGFFPTLGRLVVAGGILAVVMGFAHSAKPSSRSDGLAAGASPLRQETTMTAVNGLGVPVVIHVQGQTLHLGPQEHATRTIADGNSVEIRTVTEGGEEIEVFATPVVRDARYVYNVASATPLIEWTAAYGNSIGASPKQLGAPRWFGPSADFLFEEPPQRLVVSAGRSTRTVLDLPSGQAPASVLGVMSDDEERRRIITLHAEWDLPKTRHIGEWLGRAAEQPGFAALLERRLRRYPRDMAALRVEQDQAEGEARKALCEKTRARSAKSPEDIDWRYLTIRCEKDDAKGARAFVDEYGKHPYHPYIANAAGYEFVRLKKYENAIQAFEVAADELPMSDAANLHIARILRVMGKGDDRDRLRKLADNSSILKLLLAYETGEGMSESGLAYSQLAKGELVQAIATARLHSKALTMVLPLAAASEGATREMIEEALRPSEEREASHAIWSTIALFEREGRPHEGVDAIARKMAKEADKLFPFAKLDFLKKGRAVVEPAITKLDADQQAHACTMAIVRSAEHAPPWCREFVKAYLFVGERPYFR